MTNGRRTKLSAEVWAGIAGVGAILAAASMAGLDVPAVAWVCTLGVGLLLMAVAAVVLIQRRRRSGRDIELPPSRQSPDTRATLMRGNRNSLTARHSTIDGGPDLVAGDDNTVELDDTRYDA